MKSKKIISVMLLIFILPLFCSCYDYSELEREILIFTIGIDKVSDGYEISAETLDASDYGGELNVKPEVITSKAVSYTHLIHSVNEEQGRPSLAPIMLIARLLGSISL